MKRSAYRLFGVVLVAVSTGCAASLTTVATTPATLAYEITETTLIDGPPDVTFAAPEADLIDFHSSWLCEFQRRTFADPAGGTEALIEALIGAQISSETYESFLNRLAASQDLRDAVLFDYQETCRG